MNTIEPMEAIAVLVGATGLALSIVLAYLSHFRAANIEIVPAPRLQFYPAPSLTPDGLKWGGFGFYLPIAFHNWRSRGGAVLEVRLVLRSSSRSVAYEMSWSEFAVMHASERRWVTKSVAHPLAVEGQTSVSEIVQFVWPPENEPFEVIEGSYEVYVLAWLKRTQEPQFIFRAEAQMTREHVASYQKCKEQKLPLTMEIALSEDRSPTRLISEGDLSRW